MKNVVIYIVRDSDARPLYIGQTANLAQRMHHHRCKSRWHQDAATVATSQPMSRRHARIFERHCIWALHPKHNQMWHHRPIHLETVVAPVAAQIVGLPEREFLALVEAGEIKSVGIAPWAPPGRPLFSYDDVERLAYALADRADAEAVA